ncbi:MAG: recombinase family protein [Lachnospiraceae bacterium]|nr:recombinase family protein [Lachnospiraceae bacterium]
MGKIGYYLRLSIEDGDKEESDSIGNQRKQILEYIKQDSELCSWDTKEFCDDGYSGTSMDRPGMQEMLREIKNSQIGCIIVKDMSRFARDYIEMGNFLNQIFPFLGVRFIAINDHYDSRKQKGCTIELDTAFRTLFYDLYSKDISIKVKTSIENKCAKGEYVFGQVPFGYEKSKEVKNRVIVNEKEAQVVRYIFSLAMQGKSSTQIAKQLYKENVPTMAEIRKQTVKEDGKIHTWTASSVRKMLNNRFYIGEMVYGKTIRKAVGRKGYKVVPREKWKIVPEHHEALVSLETFTQVSCFKAGYDTERKREKHPLAGKVYCGGCKYSLNYKRAGEKNRYTKFECRKHALLQIPDCCTSISADLLVEMVLFWLNKELMLYGNFVKEKEVLELFQKMGVQALTQKLYDCQKKKKSAERRKSDIYIKYAWKEISEDIYQKRNGQISEEISYLSLKEKKIVERLEELKKEYQKEKEDMKTIIRYLHLDELTLDIVNAFVKKVYIYNKNRVEIEWNFNIVEHSNNLT